VIKVRPQTRILFIRSLCWLVPCIALAGCFRNNEVTLTGPKLAPRAANCDFQIFTIAPEGSFAEIAVVDVSGNATASIDEFKSDVQPLVCEAGGDAALAHLNGLGQYVKATILKRTGRPGEPAQSAAAESGGCRYDTQCKGDRVCVEGACGAPPAAGKPVREGGGK